MNKLDPQQKTTPGMNKSVLPPSIFSIPVVYEDGFIERDRDKYQRIQELQKSYAELQEKIKEMLEKHQLQSLRTKYAIMQSNETVSRFFRKKNVNS